jgi:hypothetical protein
VLDPTATAYALLGDSSCLTYFHELRRHILPHVPVTSVIHSRHALNCFTDIDESWPLHFVVTDTLWPRSYEIWTLSKVLALLNEVQPGRLTPLKIYSFLNKADTRGQDNGEATEVLRENTELKYIDFPVVNRKAFATAASKGLSVFEALPHDEKAMAELDALFQHIIHSSK